MVQKHAPWHIRTADRRQFEWQQRKRGLTRISGCHDQRNERRGRIPEEFNVESRQLLRSLLETTFLLIGMMAVIPLTTTLQNEPYDRSPVNVRSVCSTEVMRGETSLLSTIPL